MDKFYNLPDVYIIWHGEWADPEIEYNGKTYNYYDAEDALWSIYSENKKKINNFEEWIAADTSMVYAVLEMLEGIAEEE